MIKNNIVPYIVRLFISIIVVSILFMWLGHQRFDFNGEGYLWYGVQRTMLGEIPIRDFSSYDIGRYYWVAAILYLYGNMGIIELRFAVAIFQIIGLFVALNLIHTKTKKQDLFLLCASIVILCVWILIISHHKAFDATCSIILIAIFSHLIEAPTYKRYFLTGIVIGIVAVFGRNHGMYGVLGAIITILYLEVSHKDWKVFSKKIGIGLLGIILGYLPILIMMLCISGFGVAMWESITTLFELKTTNLPLPIPYPWHVNFSDTSIMRIISNVGIGLFFIAIVLFPVLTLISIVWRKYKNKSELSPVIIASAFMAIPYAHYAYSRADLGHLAHGIFPLLIGSIVFFSTKTKFVKYLFIGTMCVLSLVILRFSHLPAYCYANPDCVKVEVSGSVLNVLPEREKEILFFRELVAVYAPDNENILITPLMPGMYPLLQKVSPMKDSFAIFKQNEKEQQLEIERIKRADPSVILIWDLALDGRDDLRFKNTHSLIYQYILEQFDPINVVSPNSDYHIYRRIEKTTKLLSKKSD